MCQRRWNNTGSAWIQAQAGRRGNTGNGNPGNLRTHTTAGVLSRADAGIMTRGKTTAAAGIISRADARIMTRGKTTAAAGIISRGTAAGAGVVSRVQLSFPTASPAFIPILGTHTTAAIGPAQAKTTAAPQVISPILTESWANTVAEASMKVKGPIATTAVAGAIRAVISHTTDRRSMARCKAGGFVANHVITTRVARRTHRTEVLSPAMAGAKRAGASMTTGVSIPAMAGATGVISPALAGAKSKVTVEVVPFLIPAKIVAGHTHTTARVISPDMARANSEEAANPPTPPVEPHVTPIKPHVAPTSRELQPLNPDMSVLSPANPPTMPIQSPEVCHRATSRDINPDT